MSFLEQLNPEQREAVLHRDGPLLILAGAGSGKTRVICYRLAHLIGDGHAEPDQVLAVTFTNKAAEEMCSRVEQLLESEYPRLWVSRGHHAEVATQAPHFSCCMCKCQIESDID